MIPSRSHGDYFASALMALLLVFLCLPLSLFSQGDFQKADARTYRLYQEKNWDTLLTEGRQLLKSGTDYSYLRTRLGVAEYEKGRYIRAAWQLNHALRFNSNDDFSRSYLYGAYLMSNNPVQARSVYPRMSMTELEASGHTRIPTVRAGIDLGKTFSNAPKKADISSLMGPDSLYGEQNLYGDSYHGDLLLNFALGGRLTLAAGGTYLNFKNHKLFQYAYRVDQKDTTIDYPWGYSNVYSFPGTVKTNSFDYMLTQYELYLGLTWVPVTGTNISPAFRMINVKYNNTTAHLNRWAVQDTAWYDRDRDLYSTFDFYRTSVGFTQKDTSFNEFLVGLQATQEIGIFTVGLSASWSNLNGSEQLQTGYSLTYYPTGNLSFYGNTTLYTLVDRGNGRLIVSQMLGCKVFPWLWAQGSFLYGDLSNGSLGNLMVVYNTPDKIDWSGGVDLVFPLFQNLTFSLAYRYYARECPVLYYAMEHTAEGPTPVPRTKYMPYQANTVIIGINISI